MDIPSSISQKCDDLAQLLGTECLPFKEADQGTGLLPLGVTAAQARALAEEAKDGNKVALKGSSSDRILFAVPLSEGYEVPWFAIGCLQGNTIDQASKILQVALVAMQRGRQLACQEQVLLRAETDLDRSFTEREWLRQLNQQRAVRKRSVGQQSRQSLESLRTLLKAEAVAVFLYQDIQLNNCGLEPMITGRATWTLDNVRALMQRVQKPALGDSLILNSISMQLQSSQLHSCIVVPIGNIEPIGYVVAINHRNVAIDRDHPGFSSGDAELLHELAGYLLSDGNSNILIQESEQLVWGTLRAMSNAIEARDPYTHGHSERVAHVSYEIAVRMQLSEVACQEIYLAGILHDIGKIGIPDHVLMKPGKLTQEELLIIQRHPEIGHRILEELGKLKFALPGVLYHHERMDGTGYPHRLRGDAIPLMARIIAVSDAFDAMTSSRVYRNAMDRQRACEILRQGVGTQWDDHAVSACLDFIEEEELVMSDGTSATRSANRADDWRQVTQALRVLQL
jgi:HD-GYP domain-containing protein (c-di-GMP phosphodiesterase class II)